MAHKIVPARGRSGADIDRLAYKIIDKFQPDILRTPSPFDVDSFFEFDLNEVAGVEVLYGYLPQDIYGVTDSGKMTVTVSSDLADDPSQERFLRSTIAHECGHAIIHIPEFKAKKELLRSIQNKEDVSLKMYRVEQIPVYRNPEWQAYRFGGALLMPEHTFAPAVRSGKHINQLSDLFNVHPAFIRSRMRALKLQ